jgi:hypothetical protein
MVPAIEFTLSVKSFQVPATPVTSLEHPASLRTNFSRYSRYLRSKGVELIHHDVHVFFSSKISPLTSTGDFLGEVAIRYGCRHFRNVPYLGG